MVIKKIICLLGLWAVLLSCSLSSYASEVKTPYNQSWAISEQELVTLERNNQLLLSRLDLLDTKLKTLKKNNSELTNQLMQARESSKNLEQQLQNARTSLQIAEESLQKMNQHCATLENNINSLEKNIDAELNKKYKNGIITGIIISALLFMAK